VSRNDIILGVAAAALVVFSLVVALVVPRRNPGFPGRNLRLFALVSALLVVGMLAAVEVLGESHQFGEGETPNVVTEETGGTEPAETGQTETGEAPEGDPAAGKQVFAAQGCGSCHALADAGTSGEVGPNLDETLPNKDAGFIRTSIIAPNAEVAEGFQPGLMPQDYEQKLSPEELANLVAYLQQATGG
jgi:mono/diheme cytochrome c family protein